MSFDFEFESHPFISPGYLKAKLPDQVRAEIQKSIDGLENGSIPSIENRPLGRRHLTSETKLPVTPLAKEFVEDLCYEYDNVFKGGDHVFWSQVNFDDRHLGRYDAKNMWINHSYKYDFNPVHSHEGCFAFVIWVDIPYNLEDELALHDGHAMMNSLFTFQWTNAKGKLRTEPLYVDKSWEWNIIVFDAFLPHSVFPFYTSDKARVSIAGDVYVTLDTPT
jgi:hypothetical protein